MRALTESSNVIFLHPRRKREGSETSHLDRNGWIVVVLAALLFATLLGVAMRSGPVSPADLDPSVLVD